MSSQLIDSGNRNVSSADEVRHVKCWDLMPFYITLIRCDERKEQSGPALHDYLTNIQDELQWAGLRLASYNDPPPPPPPPPRSGAASFRQRWKMLHYSAALCILTSIPLVLASYPYCPCVPFNTTGRFHSPNYPANLENIDCLFYHFQAPLGSIVQITFRSFSLPVRNPICTSSLRIFDSSLDGLVDPEEEPSFTFCGHEIAPGATFYSRHEHLLLQIIHGDASSKGFIGDYRFPSKDNYLNDGIEIADCSYRIEKTKGVLYSPSYPFYYQSFVNCTYILPQRKGHRIVLSSGEISLGREATIDIFETTNGIMTILSSLWGQHGLLSEILTCCSLVATSLFGHPQRANELWASCQDTLPGIDGGIRCHSCINLRKPALDSVAIPTHPEAIPAVVPLRTLEPVNAPFFLNLI
ncbi:unnamed protein product [Haemonchus placei]|uniref:CUB domain-containing protein n=1 Tax=Haemonchus placei TaxID=6290 RepID=A0A158QN87_HAEPC|nr:unnamed protein product [Haemonchus placei]